MMGAVVTQDYELHPIEECWHPEFHPSSFNEESAAVLLAHVKDNGHVVDASRSAPLCEFRGATFSRFHHNEEASGTYAVCPDCHEVMMCGYGDDDSRPYGLGPTHCKKCDTQLSLSDYFQPVAPSGREQRADPATAPILTLVEVAAACNQPVELSTIIHVAVMLKLEGLLKTGDRVNFMTGYGDELESEELCEGASHIVFGGGGWLELDHSLGGWHYALTNKGKKLMEARNLPTQAAEERAQELLTLPRQELIKLALKAHVNST